MKSSDKLLIGIVSGIIILVVVALVITMNRPEPTYMADDMPEGVVHNYLLALQKEEYLRAYGYLSPTVYNYPASTYIFELTVRGNSYRFRLERDIDVSVGDAAISGKFATVKVTESRFYGGDLFDSGQRISTFNMELQLEGDHWKIVDSYHYFASCWTDEDRDCH
ncbi:MAG: hypothetical protein HN855_04175 [Anaerolineae bacterium]|jgi:hypothetical protein|nr:hypothetical protein [Anaerolineae bacterium]MBT7070906.1 hypothetical protein [Anaerolineae bacterium]MBT7324332.1 hypothetical protein [Anaerolineae bacterium]MBT7599799.1 hypothetical protein [Anaerolineae bacterium]